MQRMAIAHEWLAVRAGSEKTFEAMAEAYPEADLYALTWDRSAEFDFGGRDVTTTFLDRRPRLRERRELTLPMMPLAWRGIEVKGEYDTVLTSSHAFVRSFPPAKRARHFSYTYTPLRFAWVPEIDGRNVQKIPGSSLAFAALRTADRRISSSVDFFAADSTTVRERIRHAYGEDAVVIFPPVETDYYSLPATPGPRERALAISRFVPYKGIRLALEACAAAGVPLTIAGKGPEEAALRQLAIDLKADVEFEISPPDERLRELYRSSRLLVFPANEDFGIVPVEAQACGTPVVALDIGGATDTVLQGETGIRVEKQDVAHFADAIREVWDAPPGAEVCRRNAERFSRGRFIAELQDWISTNA